MELFPYKILMVDDDPNDTLLIQRALRSTLVEGHVISVENGEQAINYLAGEGEYADRDRFPLPVFILMDIKLPRKTGLEVLAWMKEKDSLRSIPVIMFTSSNQQADIKQAYDLGANSYIVKPVEYSKLEKTLRDLIHYWASLNQFPE